MARSQHPALIVLDVRMPGRSGYQVCAELRRDESTRDILILILTGQGTVASELEGIGAGADERLAKPFNVNDLRARVDALLRMRALQAPRLRADAASSSAPSASIS